MDLIMQMRHLLQFDEEGFYYEENVKNTVADKTNMDNINVCDFLF